jgi:hypothetical protein
MTANHEHPLFTPDEITRHNEAVERRAGKLAWPDYELIMWDYKRVSDQALNDRAKMTV